MSCKVLVRSYSEGYINSAWVGMPKELKRGGSFSESAAKRVKVWRGSSEEGSDTSIRLSEADQKLQQNFEEVLRGRQFDSAQIASLLELRPPQALELRFTSASQQGVIRTSMEDAHFHSSLPKPKGYLVGVFDGHGEKGRVSGLAAREFQTRFPQLEEESPGRWQENFERLCRETHEQVPVRSRGGSTALVSYFCPDTNYLITANLGDSHAMIFRKIDDVIQAIPISAERNWCHPEEAERVRAIMSCQEFFDLWCETEDPKMRRFPPYVGVNVSRALGNRSWDKSAISQVPITTLTQLSEGDLVVWACDGLWDFASIPEMIETVIAPNWGYSVIANSLVHYALHTVKSTDNVTVVCAWVKDPLASPLEEMPATPVIDDGLSTVEESLGVLNEVNDA